MIQPIEIFESNQYIDSCPECHNGVITDNLRAETICNTCGLVLSEKHTTFNENRGSHFFVSPQERNNIKRNFQMPLLNQGTFSNTYMKLTKILKTVPQYKRLVKLDRSLCSSEERNLSHSIPQLKALVNSLQLPFHIGLQALYNYKKAFKKKIIRGRTIMGMLCASIYYACRTNKIPLTIPELEEYAGINRKTITYHIKILSKELKLKIPPLEIEIYLSKYCSKLNLDYQLQHKIIQSIRKIPLSYFNGRNPRACIGGLIYYVCKDNSYKITQKEIGTVCNCTEVSIRSRIKELKRVPLTI